MSIIKEDLYVITRIWQTDPPRFWKKNNLGYSYDIEEARLFTLEEATTIVSQPGSDKVMFKASNFMEPEIGLEGLSNHWKPPSS